MKPNNLSLFILLVTIVLALLFSACTDESKAPEESGTEVERIEKTTSEITSLLNKADSKVGEGMLAINSREFDDARKKALEAKALLAEAGKLLSAIETDISPEDRTLIETYIEYEHRWSTLVYKSAGIEEFGFKLLDEIDNQEPDLLLPKMELLERGYRENANDWREFAQYLKNQEDFRKRAGIGDEDVDVLFGLADTTDELADALKDYIEVLKSRTTSYTPVADRKIPSESTQPGKGIVTAEVAKFFDSFDANGDGKLSIGEAQEFFYWVENNIEYCYDREDVTDPIIGFAVGDGRPGGDYRQPPLETLEEGAGDCEDMATLEVAFYRHFGIDAYVVGLNARLPDLLDHAAAIVWIGEHKDEFQSVLGNLLYYEIGENVKDVYGNPVRPGIYMIVDNAYSGALGYINGGTRREHS